MSDKTSNISAFSEIIPLDAVIPDGWRGEVEAGPAARESVAQRLSVPEVLHLRGSFELSPVSNGVRVAGRIDAALSRQCVVSLETMTETVDEHFEITFLKSADAREEIDAGGAVEIDPDEDAPEPLAGESLDLAEILIQQLSLAMVPYPRKPGARLPEAARDEPLRASPFAVLKDKIARGGEQG